MKTITVYIAEDGTKFLNEIICSEYEEEVAKNPNDPGIILYNLNGKEIDLKHINETAFYKITNRIIANAKLNSIRMLNIKQNIEFDTNIGYHTIHNISVPTDKFGFECAIKRNNEK